ncbi:hypothetical protein FOZ63_031347 [Perkinsus olseni]|uniref:Reverse transcriptase domain-containing protein n=1 Tax=Perkinsus olseni TaxID=32597 RepID=A0A7J6S2B6_PEROL|nr:hypothetical protein FOZ63_031347 [Perkinsus olseni]
MATYKAVLTRMRVDPVTIRKIGNAAIALGSIQFDDFCNTRSGNTYSTVAPTTRNPGVTRGCAAQVRSMKPATARRPVSCPAWIAELMAEKVYTKMLPEYNVYGRALLYYGPFKKAIYWNGFGCVVRDYATRNNIDFEGRTSELYGKACVHKTVLEKIAKWFDIPIDYFKNMKPLYCRIPSFLLHFGASSDMPLTEEDLEAIRQMIQPGQHHAFTSPLSGDITTWEVVMEKTRRRVEEMLAETEPFTRADQYQAWRLASLANFHDVLKTMVKETEGITITQAQWTQVLQNQSLAHLPEGERQMQRSILRMGEAMEASTRATQKTVAELARITTAGLFRRPNDSASTCASSAKEEADDSPVAKELPRVATEVVLDDNDCYRLVYRESSKRYDVYVKQSPQPTRYQHHGYKWVPLGDDKAVLQEAFDDMITHKAVVQGLPRRATPARLMVVEGKRNRGVSDLRDYNDGCGQAPAPKGGVREVLNSLRLPGCSDVAQMDISRAYYSIHFFPADDTVTLPAFEYKGLPYYYVRLPMGWVHSSRILAQVVQHALPARPTTKKFCRKIYADNLCYVGRPQDHEATIKAMAEDRQALGERGMLIKDTAVEWLTDDTALTILGYELRKESGTVMLYTSPKPLPQLERIAAFRAFFGTRQCPSLEEDCIVSSTQRESQRAFSSLSAPNSASALCRLNQ